MAVNQTTMGVVKHLFAKESLTHVFQPIYNIINNQIIGFEAFIRHKQIQNPEVLFNKANELNKLYDMDTISIEMALEKFSRSYLDGTYLFLNIFPSTIIHPRFPAFLHELKKHYPSNMKQVIFEINEAITEEAILDTPEFLRNLTIVKNMNIQVAMDDIGKWGVPLEKMENIIPHIIKLDQCLALKLSSTLKNQMLVRELVGYCQQHQITLILEGIEENDDLQIAKELGVMYGQGYLLARPQKDFVN
ncbi:EAL domain-containing protein [Cytobacillus spongiae]|jgi:EAL domain-containing protein (putative c-di-GMP-specific phosphodiesterase class I)|uniref:EAL domain-containing protein n=1 Tax=Cytobacillus spongiae TaxID=2901381 RepID=UPI001F2E4FFF|nr:EAL domain-containing protein [Cytobacillus spongiae]UII57755.1 EAL domain-containing protein [Cytobacillus spongiae]